MTERAFGETWAVYEALRRLGFRPEDIYFQVGGEVEAGVYQICLVLRAQGKEFTAIPMTLRGDPEDIEKLWQQFALDVLEGNISDQELHRVWDTSNVRANGAALVMSLLAKGFRLPLDWSLS